MELEEPDTNKMTSHSNLVEGNCEYLTFIKNIAVQRTRMHRDGIATIDAYMQEDKGEESLKLHFEGLVHLII